jgi:23S rRNA pseudouridine1911/1915/1917 synthase
MSEETLKQAIPAELAGRRLDQALAKMFPQYSRSRLKTWILGGSVSVDGASMRPKDTVAGGETVILQPTAELSVTSQPEPIDLDIAYEDSALLVVNKPAGLVVHPGAGNTHGTLMNGLLYHYPELAELPRAGIVHRLDKETSGLLMVARSLSSHTALVRKLADRDIARHYEAICTGTLTGGGKIDAPIRRHPVDRLRMAVQEGGRPAVTHYRLITRFAAHTHVSVKLETGRTHQIRVHFAWRRHALVGDSVYGGRLAIPAGASDELRDTLRAFRRQALCATSLEFAHPETDKTVHVVAEPADDYKQLLNALASDNGQRQQ